MILIHETVWALSACISFIDKREINFGTSVFLPEMGWYVLLAWYAIVDSPLLEFYDDANISENEVVTKILVGRV